MAVIQYEQKVIKAIQEGDLQSLKSCCIGRSDINKPFSITQDIPVVTKDDGCPFVAVRAVTPIIYCILCEQAELLSYLLQNKAADLSIRVNGWAPIHYAACTKSSACMEVLLKYNFIQENIDMPIIDDQPCVAGGGTTALHVAVSNSRHKTALLLTQDLPQIEYDANGEKIDQATLNLMVAHQPANALQMTSHGNTALHMAVLRHDWDLCQILLHVCDDSTICNSQGKSAIDLAQEYKFNDLVEKLEANELEPIEILQARYSIKKGQNIEKADDMISAASSAEIRRLQQTVENLTKIVNQLSARVSVLEARRVPTVADSGELSTKTVLIHTCRRCGTATARQCPECKSYYCNTCWNKPPHSCTSVEH